MTAKEEKDNGREERNACDARWAAFQTRKNAAARRKGGHGAC